MTNEEKESLANLYEYAIYQAEKEGTPLSELLVIDDEGNVTLDKDFTEEAKNEYRITAHKTLTAEEVRKNKADRARDLLAYHTLLNAMSRRLVGENMFTEIDISKYGDSVLIKVEDMEDLFIAIIEQGIIRDTEDENE